MKRILVKAPNWVGDCVMATPALAYLREALPDAQIDLLARPSIARVLDSHPSLDSILPGDDRKLSRQMRERIRSTCYDAAALLPNSLGSAWLAFRLGIARRVGFARGGRRLLLTHPLVYEARAWQTPTPRPLSRKSLREGAGKAPLFPGHMVSYYLRVAQATVEALGEKAPPLPRSCDVALSLAVLPEAAGRVEALLAEQGVGGRLLVGINPGAAYGGAKRWPLEQLAAVADALAASHGAAIVSTASRFESELNDQVQSFAKTPISRLGESLDLQGLVALMDRLGVLVTNDSGAMHIAAARSTPTVAIFGPTDWNVTSPWSGRAVVVRNSPECAPCFLRDCPAGHECMKAVTAKAVVRAAGELLSRTEGRVGR